MRYSKVTEKFSQRTIFTARPPMLFSKWKEEKCVASATHATGSPSSKYVVYATACVYRELYRKINDRKKKLCKLLSQLK